MITFTQLGSWGRLGNQLWQYALLKSISLKTGKEIILPTSIFDNIWHSQKCLLNNFKLKCRFENQVFPKYRFNERFSRKYDPLVFEVPEDTDFMGYFQSSKYIENYRKEILEEFELSEEIKEKAEKILNPLRKKYKKIVSVHFRRGDLINPSCIGNNFLGDDQKLTDECELGKYINNATSYFNESETLYYVITGGSRENDNTEDVAWCKKNFIRENVIYSENVEDLVEFCILTKVDANICSHASTFSWWGSYLNPNQNVIAPKNALIIEEISTEDFYPSNWNLI
jgi:hypothetical protein